MWTVYILRCSDGSFYVGLTNDLKQRIRDHQSGDGAQYTRARLPVSLKYSEGFKSKKEAENREHQLKRWSKAKKEALIKSDMAKLRQLSRNKS
ncbi:MAG: GIY-YIG nuclease family protein [Nitrospirae bacterium]|nr:GIY-YIG nuclease family protein [Nitrospirota bacterium]